MTKAVPRRTVPIPSHAPWLQETTEVECSCDIIDLLRIAVGWRVREGCIRRIAVVWTGRERQRDSIA